MATSSSGSSSASASLSPSGTVSATDGGASSNPSPPFFPTQTSGGAAATGTQDPGQGPPSSSLYLFTFLATLFLLLAISSAIIMRGIFLRRRFRRRLEEAIAAGVLLSPTEEAAGGFGRGMGGRRKLKRPTLFDVTVLPPYFSTGSPQAGKWERVMPVTASVASEKPGLVPLPPPEPTQPSDPPPQPRLTARMLLERAGYIIPRARLRRATPPTPRNETSGAGAGAGAGSVPPSPGIPMVQRDPVLRAAEVNVSVIIAMPNPHRSAYAPPAQGGIRLSDTAKGKARESGAWDDGEEEGVPDVVVGSATVLMTSDDARARESS